MDNWMPFKKPLDSHLQTKYTENFAYRILRSCFPEQYNELICSDAPDLQLPDKSIGIEVTMAVSQRTAQIEGEFSKYRVGKQTDEAKAKCKEAIEIK